MPQWNDAIIVFTDIFAIKYDLIANSASYGMFQTILLILLTLC